MFHEQALIVERPILKTGSRYLSKAFLATVFMQAPHLRLVSKLQGGLFRFFLPIICLLMVAFGSLAEGASFLYTDISDFQSGTLSGCVASDTQGNDEGFLRLRNTNPGRDNTPGDLFTNDGGLEWSRKRRLRLTETTGNDRFLEKVEVNIEQISNANDNWSDLRVVDDNGRAVPFRLLQFEEPVDNPISPVTLLFEAYASQSVSTDYWIYYRNANALSESVDSISRFYLTNHDFEQGTLGWASSTHGSRLDQAVLTGIRTNHSIVPPGYVDFESKNCLQVYYPEAYDQGSENGKWMGWVQTVNGPVAGAWIMTAYKDSISGAYNKNLRSYMRHMESGADVETDIPAGVTDWTQLSLEFNTGASRNFTVALGMIFRTNVTATWRERITQFDWVEVKPKNPLVQAFGTEENAGYLSVATFTTQELDTGVPDPEFQSISWLANTTAAGTAVSFETRAADVSGGPYTAWSSPITVNGGQITSPNKRYLQVRATLSSTDTGFTPVLDEFQIYYKLPTAKLRLDVPTTVTAGEFFEFQLTALDGLNATSTSFTETVSLLSASPSVQFPVATYTFREADHGTVTLSARTTGTGIFTLQASWTAAIATESLPITCVAAPSEQLTFVGAPGAINAGQTFTCQVVARDAYGNTDLSNNSFLELSCTDPTPGSFPANIFLSGGIATLTDIILYAGPDQTLSALDTNQGLAASETITVNPLAASALNLTSEPDQYQNTPFALTVEAIDAYGNVDPTYNGAYTLGISSGSVLPLGGTLAGGIDAVAVTLDTPGNLTLTATTPTAMTGNTGIIVHPQSPPTLDRFVVDAGYKQLAGIPFTLTIEARDTVNNVLTSYDGACRIIPDVGTCTPSITTGYKFLDGFLAIPITLSGASPTVILRIEDIKDNSKLGILVLEVEPGGLDHFKVTTPGSVTAGASCSFEVRPYDSQENLLTNYTGTIQISQSATGGEVTIPDIYTFNASETGIHLFTASEAAVFTKAEKVRIQVQDSGRVGLSDFIDILPVTGSPTLSLNPDRFALPLGERLSFNLSLTDPYENPMDAYVGSISLVFSDPSVIGPSSYTFKAFEDGFHRFTNEVEPTLLGSFTITAEHPSGASETTDLINVFSGETSNFLIMPASISLIAGESYSFDVTASDSEGNLNPLYRGTVRFSTGDSRALIPDDSILTAGAGRFGATYYTTGSYTLTVRDTVDPTILGSMSVSVVPSGSAQLRYDILVSSLSVDAGVPFGFNVFIEDEAGNPASYTGTIRIGSRDTNPSSTGTQTYNLTNQSNFSDSWTFASAGVQVLIASSTDFPRTISPKVRVEAGAPASVTGDLPRTMYSEFYYPFKIRIVDAYGNPTPKFTGNINPQELSGPTYGEEPNQHTYSPGDNGEFIFNISWDRGTGNPLWCRVRFNESGFGLTDLDWTVWLDCPRSGNPTDELANFWLSPPDRQVIASQPFNLFLRANTGRDKMAASLTETIEFDITDGEVFVNDGSGWGKTITMTNQNTISFQAYVTRTGYLTLIAKASTERLKTGSVSFVSQPGELHSMTITSDSPQPAGVRFAPTTNWWDVFNNYAERATDSFTFSAIATAGYLLEPGTLLAGGRGGEFNPSENTTWTDAKFWTYEQQANIYNDVIAGQIRLQGQYDEDFTDSSLDNPNWQTQNFGASNGTYGLGEQVLKIETIGNGTLFNDGANDYRDNIDDGYFFLYQDWPATDTYPFEARMYILRYWYDTDKRTNHSLVGLMMKDDAPNGGGLRPRYICAQMHNTPNSNDFNMNTYSQITYRNNPGNNTTYRLKVANDSGNTNNGNSGTHPKWIRIRRTGGNNFEGAQSNDGNTWADFTYEDDPGFTAPQPAFATPRTISLGICVAAGSNTYPGRGWITEFRVNRYPNMGSFTSIIYDVGTSTVTYGTLTLDADKPGSSQVQVYCRASNDPTMSGIPWRSEGDVTSVNLNNVNYNGSRYFQYSLILVPNVVVAGVNDATPAVSEVTLTYTAGNLGDTFFERGIVELTASASPTINDSCEVEIQGGTPTDLEITAPASTTAGNPFSITVTARDAYGNVADTASGTWRFSTSDGAPYEGEVPGDYTLVPAADKGTHTFFNASILKSRINQTISVEDGTIVSTSSPILVNPGPLDHFVASAPTPVPASTAFNVWIRAEDEFENQKADHQGDLTFFDDHTGGRSSYNPPNIASGEWIDGLATLTPGVSFTKSELVTISVLGDNRSGVANPVEVQGATTTNLILKLSTTQPESGAPFNLTVTARDIFGNTAQEYRGEIAFSSNDPDPGVVLPGNYTFTAGDAGSRTWNLGGTLITPGPVNVRVEDTVAATMSYDFPVTVLPGPVTRFELAANATQTAGVPFNLTIKAYDSRGNLKTNFSESIDLITSFTSVLPLGAGGFSNGQLLIPSAELDETGPMPATNPLGAKFGGAIGTMPITLLPPSAVFDHIEMEAIPATPTAGDAFKLVVKMVGPSGAVYTSYAGTGVSLTASNTLGNEVAPPMTPDSATSFTNGVKEVYARIWEAGEITIWAHDLGIPGKLGSFTVNILPTNLSYFTVTPGTSTVEPFPNVYYQSVNGSFPLYLSAYDSLDNIKSDYDGTTLLTTNGTGSLSVASVTFVDGVATIPAIFYDTFGTMRITVTDSLLSREGSSADISFFGALNTFAITAFDDQTDAVDFLVGLEAIDEYGQVKKNTVASVSAVSVDWSPTGNPADVSITPSPIPVTWNDGKAFYFANADRPAPPPSIGTYTFRVLANSYPNASGTKTIRISEPGLGAVDHFLVEMISPQTADEPFPMLVKAVDSTNAVVNYNADTTMWARFLPSLAAEPIYPGTIAAGDFVGGVYATTTARIANPGTYRVNAVSGAIIGTYTPLVIEAGPIDSLLVTMPIYAQLNGNFTMTVAGLTKTGDIKTDYVPAGPVLLKLNATATGFLAISSIAPAQFVNGVATLTTQVYNKSQTIWIRAREPKLIQEFTGGPTKVFGPPVKFILEPLPSIANPFYWSTFYEARLTVTDANGFIVSNYSGDVAFDILAGSAPTATDPALISGTDLQFFSSLSEGIQTFTFKADYSTLTSPINLRMHASDTLNGIFTTTTDMTFLKEIAFDHYEIISPASGSIQRKDVPFPFTVRAIDNYDNPFTLVSSAPLLFVEQVVPTGLTAFSASPTSPLSFVNESEITVNGYVTYEEDATATVRYIVMPESGPPASTTTEFRLVLDDPRLMTELTEIQPSRRYVLSMYIKTLDEANATGTGMVEVAMFNPTFGPASYVRLADLNNSDGSLGTSMSTSGHHDWKRYWWWFDTDADTSSITVRLGVNAGVVYFDGIQLEPSVEQNNPRPAVFSPHRINIIHPVSQGEEAIDGEKLWQK